MLSEIIYKLPYLLFFLPLISSILNCIFEDKKLSVSLTVDTVFLQILLLLLCAPYFFSDQTVFLDTTVDFIFLGGEYKLNLINITFLTSVLFIHLVTFFNYNYEILQREVSNIQHRKFFFAVYMMHIFATVGLFLSADLFNLFIFLEIYSFTLYTLIASYKDTASLIVSFKYFSSGVFGSLIIFLSVFFLSMYFGSSSILYINQKLSSIQIEEDKYLLSIFLLFLFGIINKFFTLNFNIKEAKVTKKITINFLFVSSIFINVAIGFYLILHFLFFIFNPEHLLNLAFIKYSFYSLGIALIMIYSVVIYKKQTVMNISLYSSFIDIGFILLAIAMNNKYSTYLSVLFLLDHLLVNLNFYLIAKLLSELYDTARFHALNGLPHIKNTTIFLLLSKIILPLGISPFLNYGFYQSVMENREFYLFVPFVIVKITYLISLIKVLRSKKSHIPPRIAKVSKIRIRLLKTTINLISLVLLLLTAVSFRFSYLMNY